MLKRSASLSTVSVVDNVSHIARSASISRGNYNALMSSSTTWRKREWGYSEEWRVKSEEWRMKNEEWRVKNEEWRMIMAIMIMTVIVLQKYTFETAKQFWKKLFHDTAFRDHWYGVSSSLKRRFVDTRPPLLNNMPLISNNPYLLRNNTALLRNNLGLLLVYIQKPRITLFYTC